MGLHSNFNFNRKYSEDESFFSSIDTPVQAKVLGFIFADGNVGQNGKHLTIELNYRDIDYLRYIRKALKNNGPIRTRLRQLNGKLRRYAYWSINNKKIVQDLQNLGVVPNKTRFIVFPNIKPELMGHFLSGYFEGDGCLYHNTKRKTFALQLTCGSKPFLQDIAKILNEASVNTRVETPRQRNTYLLRVSGNRQVLDVLSWLYYKSPFVMARKFKKFRLLKEMYVTL